MIKFKKHPKDMTAKELAKRVFPPKLLNKLKEISHEKDNPPLPNKSAPST